MLTTVRILCRREILCANLVFRYDAGRITSHPEGASRMSFSTRYLPAVLLAILSLPTLLWAQAVPKPAAKAPRGSISGKVTIKEKGAPGVVVSLRKSESTNPFEKSQKGTTDQNG